MQIHKSLFPLALLLCTGFITECASKKSPAKKAGSFLVKENYEKAAYALLMRNTRANPTFMSKKRNAPVEFSVAPEIVKQRTASNTVLFFTLDGELLSNLTVHYDNIFNSTEKLNKTEELRFIKDKLAAFTINKHDFSWARNGLKNPPRLYVSPRTTKPKTITSTATVSSSSLTPLVTLVQPTTDTQQAPSALAMPTRVSPAHSPTSRVSSPLNASTTEEEEEEEEEELTRNNTSLSSSSSSPLATPSTESVITHSAPAHQTSPTLETSQAATPKLNETTPSSPRQTNTIIATNGGSTTPAPTTTPNPITQPSTSPTTPIKPTPRPAPITPSHTTFTNRRLGQGGIVAAVGLAIMHPSFWDFVKSTKSRLRELYNDNPVRRTLRRVFATPQ